ncbi:MAG: FKBP-type peptidyl-prolyl cis-trans isomerase [Prevotella sp.]|nr:FKBP-type peptidyl-prolyl cis-trans isomerase [Prevotella sp.]
MKKTLIAALALIVAGASFTTAEAAKKKKKEAVKAAVVVPAPVSLVSGSDSLSYIAGMTFTEGLLPYLQNQMKVDTAYMADFVNGFREAIAASSNPKAVARMAGMQIAEQVKQRMLPGIRQEFTDTPDSIVEQILFRGFTDALTADTTHFTSKAAQELFRTKQQVNKQAKTAKLTEAGRKFLAENKTKPGIITTPSGLQYEVLVQGEGDVPQKSDKVKVHYEGRLIDGTVFDASSKHGTEPSSFRADQVIKGWTEALTMMPVGSKWRLYIPQELAYGERQAGQIPPYSTLIFDVELVGIEK